MKTDGERVSVGARVKIVPQHWLRPYEEGLVIDYQPHAQNKWLVKFAHSYSGGGIGGDKLWFDESQFSEVHQRSLRTEEKMELDDLYLPPDRQSIHVEEMQM